MLKLTNIVQELKKGLWSSHELCYYRCNTHDCTQAEKLIDKVIHKGAYVLADRAYDTDKIIEYITFKSAISTIPPRKNRKIQRYYDKQVYKSCNQIE